MGTGRQPIVGPADDAAPGRARRRSEKRSGRLRSALTRLAADDPGFNRLRVASRASLAIVLALVGEWLFVTRTGALETAPPAHPSPAALAIVAAQHHDMLVVAMLIGALVAMIAGMNANEPDARGQALTILYIASAVAATLSLGLALGPHRVPALVVMVALLVVGAYGRRFGQRGAVTGVLMFIGYFFGFFLSAELGVSAAGWLAAEVALAGAAALIVRLALFPPSPEGDLRRALRTYRARVRRVLDLSLVVLEDPSRLRRRAVQRWLARLGEGALIVEGQLDRPDASWSAAGAAVLHRRLFDMEVAVTNIARFVDMLSQLERDPPRSDEIRRALCALADGDLDGAHAAAHALRQLAGESTERIAGAGTDAPGARGAPLAEVAPGALARQAASGDASDMTRWVLLQRYANAADDLAGAMARWRTPLPGAGPGQASFQPAVSLRAGWLPGSADVSAEAAQLPSNRVRLAPYVRTTAQMAVAVTIAIVAGDALSAQRFYWAVIAALLALVGTNTVAEQLRKALYRVTGTLAGVVAGTALVEVVGHHSLWSLVVVVGTMWIGIYFFRVNYALMAMAVTVSLSQAYLSLGEFSDGLLWERLAETAVGAAAAMITVVVVVPLGTRKVVDVAMASVVESLGSAADAGAGALEGTSTIDDLRSLSRHLDAAFQALLATAQPLRMVAWSDSSDALSRQLRAIGAARDYARNLVFDAAGAADAVGEHRLAGARAVLAASTAIIVERLRGERVSAPYVRSGSLWADAERGTGRPGADGSPALALRDLVLLDNALAAMALASGLDTERLSPSVLVAAPEATSPTAPGAARQHAPEATRQQAPEATLPPHAATPAGEA